VFDSRLVLVAFAVTVLSLVESSAVGRSIADRTGDRLDMSVEFAGQGLSNIAAAFTGGYPVSGSLSRSALNYSAGAATRLSGILAGVSTAVMLIVAGPLVDRTPIPALAGLLMVVAYDLVNMTRIQRTLRTSRGDALAFLVTLIGTWTLRLDYAIYLGVAMSIVLFLRRARMLVVHELEVSPRGRLREVSDTPGERCPSVRVVHVEGPLFFGAAGELRDALSEYARDPALRALVVRIKRTQGLDLTTARVLVTIADQLAKRNAELFLVGMRPSAMKVLEGSDVIDQIGEDHVFPTRPGWFHALDAGLAAALEMAKAPAESPLRRYLALRAAARQRQIIREE
jgi:SulP family sulfate permease